MPYTASRDIYTDINKSRPRAVTLGLIGLPYYIPDNCTMDKLTNRMSTDKVRWHTAQLITHELSVTDP